MPPLLTNGVAIASSKHTHVFLLQPDSGHPLGSGGIFHPVYFNKGARGHEDIR